MEHYDEDGDSEWACGGDDDCSSVEHAPECESGYTHRWTRKGTGGCDSNPGVWSLGGTSISYERRCVICGAREIEVRHGSQRDPGQCDERQYLDGVVDEAEATEERRRQDRNARRRRLYARRRDQAGARA